MLGAGKLGEAIMAGLLSNETVRRDQIVATAGHRERIHDIADRYQVRATLENRAAVEDAALVLLCVKPQVIGTVLSEIKQVLREDQLVVSTAASVSTGYIQNLLGRPIPVVRTMPNTPCLLGKGMTALCAGRHAREHHLQLAREVFNCLGRTILLEERYMDAVTGLSASGPAYVYIIIEALTDGGVKMGLPRDVATELTSQMVLGAASMVLETGKHPAQLKDIVTTPAGCTIDGILELEEGRLRVTLIKAVVQASLRARELLHT